MPDASVFVDFARAAKNRRKQKNAYFQLRSYVYDVYGCIVCVRAVITSVRLYAITNLRITLYIGCRVLVFSEMIACTLSLSQSRRHRVLVSIADQFSCLWPE